MPRLLDALRKASRAARAQRGPHVIVLGNEKGGAGKSTTAMHVAVHLAYSGRRVATLDLDARQGTLTRYVENRTATALRDQRKLPRPAHMSVAASTLRDRDAAEADERQRLEAALATLNGAFDVLVIDTPGSDTHLGRMAHALADTLITPMNDSLIDLDVLAAIDPRTSTIVGPSIYSEMVWAARRQRRAQGGSDADWIVMRNRLSALDSRNKRQMNDLLEQLGHRLGFRVLAGFSERVVYRELFLRGLTVLDVDPASRVGASHAAARAEVEALMRAIRVETVQAL